MTITASTDAVPLAGQPARPCHDCPMRRNALPGWLGGATPEEYLRLIHSDLRVDCHAFNGPQCAGVAIYRANVYKKSRDPTVLRLPMDTHAVFGTPLEFLTHHTTEA